MTPTRAILTDMQPMTREAMADFIFRQASKPVIRWHFVAARGMWRWCSNDGQNSGFHSGVSNDSDIHGYLAVTRGRIQ